MSTNRLFIYDRETNTATCIAKGFTNGWGNREPTHNLFFEGVEEYTGNLTKEGTKLELKTEDNLPRDCKVFWKDKAAVFGVPLKEDKKDG